MGTVAVSLGGTSMCGYMIMEMLDVDKLQPWERVGESLETNLANGQKKFHFPRFMFG